jgi:hypothetical protein
VQVAERVSDDWTPLGWVHDGSGAPVETAAARGFLVTDGCWPPPSGGPPAWLRIATGPGALRPGWLRAQRPAGGGAAAEHNHNKPKPFVWKADPERVLAAIERGKQALESIHSYVRRFKLQA